MTRPSVVTGSVGGGASSDHHWAPRWGQFRLSHPTSSTSTRGRRWRWWPARLINAAATAATPDRIVSGRGTPPGYIRCDYGPELAANALRDWCRFSGTGGSYIEPGTPWENPYVESLNGPAARQVLDLNG